jgi:hypothetical protein
MTTIVYLFDAHAALVGRDAELRGCDRRGGGRRYGKSAKSKTDSGRERDQSLLHPTISCAAAGISR